MKILTEDTKFSPRMIAFLKRPDIQDFLNKGDFKSIFRCWNLSTYYGDDELYDVFAEIGVDFPTRYEFVNGICTTDWADIVNHFKEIFTSIQLDSELIFRGASIDSKKIRGAILGTEIENSTRIIDITEELSEWLYKVYPYYSYKFEQHELNLGSPIEVNGKTYTEFVHITLELGAI